MTKNIVILILIILIGVGAWAINRQYNTLTDLINLNEVVNSDLTTERNANGELVSRIEVIETENTNLFTKLVFKDSTIVELQQLVRNSESLNRQLNSAIIFKDRLIIQYRDSLLNKIDSIIYIDSIGYPIYTRDFALTNPYTTDSINWIKGYVRLGLNMFSIDIIALNQYDIVIGRERKNIFKSYKTYAEITNKNPYTVTDEFRVYSKNTLRAKKFGIGIFVGYGMSNKGLSPIVGIGGYYSIIRF